MSFHQFLAFLESPAVGPPPSSSLTHHHHPPSSIDQAHQVAFGFRLFATTILPSNSNSIPFSHSAIGLKSTHQAKFHTLIFKHQASESPFFSGLRQQIFQVCTRGERKGAKKAKRAERCGKSNCQTRDNGHSSCS